MRIDSFEPSFAYYTMYYICIIYGLLVLLPYISWTIYMIYTQQGFKSYSHEVVTSINSNIVVSDKSGVNTLAGKRSREKSIEGESVISQLSESIKCEGKENTTKTHVNINKLPPSPASKPTSNGWGVVSSEPRKIVEDTVTENKSYSVVERNMISTYGGYPDKEVAFITPSRRHRKNINNTSSKSSLKSTSSPDRKEDGSQGVTTLVEVKNVIRSKQGRVGASQARLHPSMQHTRTRSSPIRIPASFNGSTKESMSNRVRGNSWLCSSPSNPLSQLEIDTFNIASQMTYTVLDC